MLQISARIQTILDLCIPADCIADIGVDHGIAACGLLLQQKARRVIATDISLPSLQKAEALAEMLELSSKMCFRQGNGLRVLRPGEAAGIVLAGMGAPLIVEILKENLAVVEAAEYLVLCAHSYPERLRSFCGTVGFAIEEEQIVADNGRYYTVMRILPGQSEPAYTDLELLVGRHTVCSETYVDWLSRQINAQGRVLCELTRGVADSPRHPLMRRKKALLEEAYQKAITRTGGHA